MKQSMTANEVIRNWIKSKMFWYDDEFDFSCVEIQVDVVTYGKNLGIYHTPDLYSREWRKIREDIRHGREYGFTVEEFKKEGEVIKWYRVTKS